jgi:hypothetical protein
MSFAIPAAFFRLRKATTAEVNYIITANKLRATGTNFLRLLIVEASAVAVWDIDLLRRKMIGREVTMNRDTEPFVHVFLFRCPDRGCPISLALATGERNMEETDSRSFVLHCNCGWSGNLIGLEAKKHWVEPWN